MKAGHEKQASITSTPKPASATISQSHKLEETATCRGTIWPDPRSTVSRYSDLCESLKYAGTVMTASVMGCPKCAWQ